MSQYEAPAVAVFNNIGQSIDFTKDGGGAFDLTSMDLSPTSGTVTPEPASVVLLATGLFGIGMTAKRRRKVA